MSHTHDQPLAVVSTSTCEWTHVATDHTTHQLVYQSECGTEQAVDMPPSGTCVCGKSIEVVA